MFDVKCADFGRRTDLRSLPVCLVQDLASCDQDVVVAALRRCSQCSLRREGLHAVSKLLKDPRGKVSALASAALRSVAKRPRLRVQVRGHGILLSGGQEDDQRNLTFSALEKLYFS